MRHGQAQQSSRLPTHPSRHIIIVVIFSPGIVLLRRAQQPPPSVLNRHPRKVVAIATRRKNRQAITHQFGQVLQLVRNLILHRPVQLLKSLRTGVVVGQRCAEPRQHVLSFINIASG